MRRPPRALLLVLALLLTASGCGLAAPGGGDTEPEVTILGPWTDAQERQFKDVLDGFGIPYTYQGTAATREVLLAEVQAGDPPDIAILPGVGELVEYADEGRLKPLTGLYEPEEYGRPWLPEAEGLARDLWVPLKVDLKSIVWYREGETPPTAPAPLDAWCAAMGDDGSSGWPGSDWIEDLLLQQAGPGLYERWATGDLDWTADHVVTAWTTWAGLLAQASRARREAILEDDHRGPADGHGLLFGGGCALEHQGSFARSFYGDHRDRAAFTDSAPLLPGGRYTVKAREVSADFAALFGDGDRARALIRRLTSERAQEEWGRRGGVFSANSAVPARPGRVEQEVARRFADQRVPLCLDASDVMPAAVRDAFYEAVLLTVAHPDEPVLPRLEDIQDVQDAQPDTTPRLTGVCRRPQ
ncbi:alpha-glucoside transport system substrate-binding protein [Streptomyces sp. KhCrAH-43]|uniref:extracellular solute-binding protein n=1 Tax=unclassified Streptomyces TaxID=2593676 RepID=UPI0003628E76|nr:MULTISPECIES: extracellular solute-binding protein [unclassified Streptomyces]MYS37750.1 extracellular solute-binding protein [Streptomyces sp. SID4920]MYX65937.1 extracellular solute-binding protein [Streptomyces sp. SID8373]RAJ67417.1 alpha-glucoside transport system substrate-binding protein [Streptomyces sp. KhCrAH-43]